MRGQRVAKTRTIYICQQCGAQQSRWMGKCPDCSAWDSFTEQVERKESSASGRAIRMTTPGEMGAPIALRDVATDGFARFPVLFDELSRVLGGGLVPGSLVLLGGDPGIGKCVVGSTRILDPETGEYFPITAWAERLRPTLSLDRDSYRLLPQPATHFHDQGIRPVVEVTTRLGRRLRCTRNHPLLTPEGWQPVDQLAVGTRIASPRSLPYFGSHPMPEHEVKLIAYMLSDGAAHSATVVTSALPEVEADLHELADQFNMELNVTAKVNNRAKSFAFVVRFGERARARQEIAAALKALQRELGISWMEWARRAQVNDSKLNTWRRARAAPRAEELRQLAEAAGVPIARLMPHARDRAEMTTQAARLLERVGLRYATAATKAVPEAIFRLPKLQLALFLKILFSCDGSVYVTKNAVPALSYSTISRQLAEDVQHLLLRFGLVTKLRTKQQRVKGLPYTAYEIQMLGVSEVRRFLAEIGIWGRNAAQQQITSLPTPTLASTHFDTVPTGPTFWQHLGGATGGISLRVVSQQAGVTIRNRRHERPLTRMTVMALAAVYPTQLLSKLAYGDVYWDEIETISDAGEERVYDLSVPAGENFVANNLIVHNSSLLTQVAAQFADEVGPALYVSAEESAQQIKLRTTRMGLDPERLLVYSETSLDAILEQIRHLRPRLVIVDSIQTVYLEDITSAAGSVSQVREGALRLLRAAKELGTPIFLVGHVTKEGAIAGPRVLEHIVDAVLYLEGERFHQYRLLRGVKNRFGSTDEVGVFEMTQTGMQEVANPSQVFLAERSAGTPGSAVAVTMEGTRPLLVEVQALTATTASAQPRRTANGFDMNRLLMLIAVLSKRVGLPLFNQDVYVNIVGGLKISEPAVDLAVAVAIASSFRNARVRTELALVGEIGLSGELRSASHIERRLGEAAKLGFTQAICPASPTALMVDGMEIATVRSLIEAVDQSLVGGAQRASSERRRPAAAPRPDDDTDGYSDDEE
jgi:DNA repair protein RadA/Sms